MKQTKAHHILLLHMYAQRSNAMHTVCINTISIINTVSMLTVSTVRIQSTLTMTLCYLDR